MTLLRFVSFLCGVGASLAASELDESIAVRAAAYNVEFSRSASPEQIGEMFKPFNLDIIGFNEAPDGDWTDRVGKVLGMQHSFVGKISSANHKNKYKTILSRTPLYGKEEYMLEGGGWKPASVVRAMTQIDGHAFAFYSLHICASGKADGHAYCLATKILPKESAERVIVAGDFNNKIGDEAMNTIEGNGMRPTWKDFESDITKQFTWNVLDPSQNAGVIDHILYNTSSGAKAAEGAIIELEKPLSDHKPIWAKIVFPLKIIKVER